MSSSESLYCGHCKKEVHYHLDPVKHGKHLLVSVLSLGLWFPIWMCAIFAPSKICDECGSPIWNDPAAKPVSARRNGSA